MEQMTALRNELLNLEQKYWNAICKNDSTTAAALSDDTCLVVGAQGVSELRRSMLKELMNNATYELEDFAIEDVHMHPLTDDIVALAYKVREQLSVNGKPVALEAFDSSIWQRRDGRWVCAVHTESPIGAPFGRK